MSVIPEDLPIAFFAGKQDFISNEIDVGRTVDELGSRVVMRKEYDQFDHLCFLVCKDMSWIQDIQNLLDNYSVSNNSESI